MIFFIVMSGAKMINWDIVPFKGVGKFKLYSSVAEVKKILDEEKISYSEKIRDNKECTNPEPWIELDVTDTILFWFVKDRLFQIWIEKGFMGCLPNGLTIGMPIEDACKIDTELKFDDWEEDWQSPLGYWIQDEATSKIVTITIFVEEVLDNDFFYTYEWKKL